VVVWMLYFVSCILTYGEFGGMYLYSMGWDESQDLRQSGKSTGIENFRWVDRWMEKKRVELCIRCMSLYMYEHSLAWIGWLGLEEKLQSFLYDICTVQINPKLLRKVFLPSSFLPLCPQYTHAEKPFWIQHLDLSVHIIQSLPPIPLPFHFPPSASTSPKSSYKNTSPLYFPCRCLCLGFSEQII